MHEYICARRGLNGLACACACMVAQVNLQKWVIKAVIRIMRLRYELLDNGSIARLVLK
jgi:hypothetical protein